MFKFSYVMGKALIGELPCPMVILVLSLLSGSQLLKETKGSRFFSLQIDTILGGFIVQGSKQEVNP